MITEMEIREIEEAKDDSNRMFRAVKNLQRMKTKTPLTIDSDGGVTKDPDKQTVIISGFFKSMFTDQNAKEIEHIPPAEMRQPFTENEKKVSSKKLEKQQKPGIDEITAEHLKNGPDLVYEKIATLLNHTAATGDFPKELNCGVLIPLQKPGKKTGTTSEPSTYDTIVNDQKNTSYLSDQKNWGESRPTDATFTSRI